MLRTTSEPITFFQTGQDTSGTVPKRFLLTPFRRRAQRGEDVVCCVAGGLSAAASAAAPAATAVPVPDLGPCLGLSPDLIPDRRLPQSPTPRLGPGSPGTALPLRNLC